MDEETVLARNESRVMQQVGVWQIPPGASARVPLSVAQLMGGSVRVVEERAAAETATLYRNLCEEGCGHSLCILSRAITRELRGMGFRVDRHPWRPDMDQPRMTGRKGPNTGYFANSGTWEGPAGRWAWMHFDNSIAPRRHVEFLMRHFDGSICPSLAVKEALLDSGVPERMLAHVPNGIDGDLFRLDGDELDVPGVADRFMFLTTGAMSERKGLDAALAAYGQEFGAQDPVALVVRNYSYGQDGWCRELIDDWHRRLGERAPLVVYLYETWTPEQMAGAYRRAARLGAYLAPSRVEGFGLTGLEAMACGARLGTTGWSGVLDYATKDNAALFRYKLEPSNCNLILYDEDETPIWAEPRVSDIRRWMRRVFETKPDRKRLRGISDDVRARFTFRRQAEAIARVLGLRKGTGDAARGPGRPAMPRLSPVPAPGREGMETLGVGIPTRDRPQYLLMLLSGLLAQTRRPDAICVVDDGDGSLAADEAVQRAVAVWEQAGVPCEIVPGTGRGASPNHQVAAEVLQTDLILRLDDDLVPADAEFVERIYRQIAGRPEVGAVGGVYPRWNDGDPRVYAQTAHLPGMRNTVDDMRRGQVALQFHRYSDEAVVECEHLYSSWMYRRRALMDVGGFADCYSRFGQREETDASVRLRLLAGLKLLVVTNACAYHFVAPGGRRTEARREALQHDLRTFEERYAGWLRETAT